ncbi:hypothetical protein [Actinoplanes siamensis]|uniref:Uncharacterized protein n=1 Tax=Actinoplanes siamensis TaxID=1223317 RepID=A0A919TME7_9ACTN|nr:hypothetical protein [Actinoplanes siamensis]GIF06985.1 hypothetical protein Asi03nite_45230 [Actinoplanes siamensis]
MEASIPRDLQEFVTAGPHGWRVVLIPRFAAHLLTSAGAGLLIPAVVATPLTLVALAVAVALGGLPALWQTAVVLFVVFAVAGVVVAGISARVAATEVRWLDLRSDRTPATLTVRQGLRSREIALSDLREVTVAERHKLDAFLGVRVTLHTGLETISGDFEPARRAVELVDAAGLAHWMADRLAVSEVPVRHQVVRVPARLTVESWWPAEEVAAIWEVPVEQVPDIAEEHEVRVKDLAPRVGAMHMPGRTVTLYNPDDVHRLGLARRGVPLGDAA